MLAPEDGRHAVGSIVWISTQCYCGTGGVPNQAQMPSRSKPIKGVAVQLKRETGKELQETLDECTEIRECTGSCKPSAAAFYQKLSTLCFPHSVVSEKCVYWEGDCIVLGLRRVREMLGVRLVKVTLVITCISFEYGSRALARAAVGWEHLTTHPPLAELGKFSFIRDGTSTIGTTRNTKPTCLHLR
eukprot:4934440-Pyramimonas_sp.AAC.1